MSLVFKELLEKNIDEVTNLMIDFYAIDNYPIDKDLTKQNFRLFIANKHLGQAWLIYNEKQIIGYLILAYLFSFEFGGKIAFLDELYISDKARGKGIGRKAVQFVKNFAKETDLKILFLEVENHNLPAQELYKKEAFKNHHRGLMIYKKDDL